METPLKDVLGTELHEWCNIGFLGEHRWIQKPRNSSCYQGVFVRTEKVLDHIRENLGWLETLARAMEGTERFPGLGVPPNMEYIRAYHLTGGVNVQDSRPTGHVDCSFVPENPILGEPFTLQDLKDDFLGREKILLYCGQEIGSVWYENGRKGHWNIVFPRNIERYIPTESKDWKVPELDRGDLAGRIYNEHHKTLREAMESAQTKTQNTSGLYFMRIHSRENPVLIHGNPKRDLISECRSEWYRERDLIMLLHKEGWTGQIKAQEPYEESCTQTLTPPGGEDPKDSDTTCRILSQLDPIMCRAQYSHGPLNGRWDRLDEKRLMHLSSYLSAHGGIHRLCNQHGLYGELFQQGNTFCGTLHNNDLVSMPSMAQTRQEEARLRLRAMKKPGQGDPR